MSRVTLAAARTRFGAVRPPTPGLRGHGFAAARDRAKTLIMNPKEIAVRTIIVNKHPERDEWWIVIQSPRGSAGIQLGASSTDHALLETYAGMVREVVTELAQDVAAECVSVARELESTLPGRGEGVGLARTLAERLHVPQDDWPG